MQAARLDPDEFETVLSDSIQNLRNLSAAVRDVATTFKHATSSERQVQCRKIIPHIDVENFPFVYPLVLLMYSVGLQHLTLLSLSLSLFRARDLIRRRRHLCKR